MHLVMLETNGNQQYVFSSPRQRENIGASYLVTLLSTWTTEELRAVGLTEKPATDTSDGLSGSTFQWVSKASGKVILTVPDEPTARTLISGVTRRAHAQAPSIDVTGVFCPTASAHVTAADLRRIHAIASRYGVSRPAAAARFAQAPFLRPADDSALPASPAILEPAEPGPAANRSLPSRVKRAAGEKARERLLSQARREMGLIDDVTLARHLKDLERSLDQPDGFDQIIAAVDADPENASAHEDANAPGQASPALSRVAVVHIDGNGVGAIMQDLDSRLADVRKAIGTSSLRDILHGEDSTHPGTDDPGLEGPDDLRLFLLQVSARLDAAVHTAFFTAWARVAAWSEEDQPGPQHVVPVVPILLGGDDATVLTEGRYAIPFMDAYLTAYEHATSADPLLRHLGPASRQAPGTDDGPVTGPMTAAAGAAIVRRTFPFHIAYDLAERLVTHAKTIGKRSGEECSTLTYHQLFDSTVTDAPELLRSYRLLTGRPYRLNTQGTAIPVPDVPTTAPAPAGCAEPDAHPELAPLSGQAWPDMLRRVRRYGPPTATNDDALDVPKTRAARIRKELSDSHRAATRATPMQISELVAGEWEDLARTVHLPETSQLDEALGSPRLLLDLIELSELLPPAYVRDMTAAGRERTETAEDDAAKEADHD